MSTILKALRRLEQDKTAGVVRPLRQQVAVREDPDRRWLAWLLTGVAAMLGAAAGAAALWMWPGPALSPATRATPPSAAIAPAPPAPAPAVATPPVATPPAPAVAAPPARSVAASPARPAPARRPRRAEIEREASDLPAAALASPVSVVERASPRRDPMEDTVSAPALARASERAAPITQARTPVPPVEVLQTVWHPDASQRTARVQVEEGAEPTTLREGDAVGSLVVVRIEPAAVVFRHDAVEIRRRIGRP